MEAKKQRKYYKIGEKVFYKTNKTEATITGLTIIPKSQSNTEGTYKATIQYTKDGANVTTVVPLWEITKLAKTYKINTSQKVKNQQLTIKVKYFDEACKIEKIEKGDWIDLRSAKNLSLKAGDFALIPLGVAMELPEGYEAHVLPRSSTFKNFGITQTNSMGVIDESYKGDNDQWFLPVLAQRDTVINLGNRIAQFRIQRKMPTVVIEEVATLDNENRGGHGSTGTK